MATSTASVVSLAATSDEQEDLSIEWTDANGGQGHLFYPASYPARSRGPAFEVATVKPGNLPQANGRGGVTFLGKSGGPDATDPGQITWPLVTLKNLLTTAYDVKAYQVTGLAWLDTERYAIVAKVPPGATAEQVNLMWQNLLADRFGVVVHHESKA